MCERPITQKEHRSRELLEAWWIVTADIRNYFDASGCPRSFEELSEEEAVAVERLVAVPRTDPLGTEDGNSASTCEYHVQLKDKEEALELLAQDLGLLRRWRHHRSEDSV